MTVSRIVLLGLLFLFITTAYSQENVKRVHVKFRKKYEHQLTPDPRARSVGFPMMDQVTQKHKALEIRRIFPPAGKFEAAHRAYDLHLWYEVTFSNETSTQNVVADYNQLEYFDRVEEAKPYTRGWNENESNAKSFKYDVLPSGTNDPFFPDQWHYENTGQNGGTPHADINLLKAWKLETGSKDVIVAVIDGGIDFNHPDLQGSAWTNALEIPDNSIDDDNNGYVDDVHGYGFGDQYPTIFGNQHATHVGGTIGAVSNNGVGVSGIAGGDGTGNGVRLMTCAAFGALHNGGFEAAMVYAADNGAVISQNSWGGGSSSIEYAIDYFIARAGLDNSNENLTKNIQIGPMAGGLVIFAAGNDNTSSASSGYPASYSRVVAVAATDRYDRKAPFSNFGQWVDISAPGFGIMSTISNGIGSYSYGYLNGTSMACPHVSGVAALVVSRFKGQGLTPGQVWARIQRGAHSISALNPGYEFYLGIGRVDALTALRDPDAIPPGNSDDLQLTTMHYSSAILEWTSVGEDGQAGQANEFDIRYSTSPISMANFESATKATNIPLPPVAGTHVKFEVPNLTPQTTYYFALKTIDLFGNQSGVTAVSGTTLAPPKLEVITTSLSEQLYSGGTSTQQIQVKNSGQDELLVRPGVPQLNGVFVGSPFGAKARLFAVNPSTSSIEELNTKTGAVIHSIPLPALSSGTLEGLAFDGTYLYYGKTNVIYKINAATGEVLRSFVISGFNVIKGLGWSGQYLYVSGSQVVEVDSDNGNIVRTLYPYTKNEISSGGNRGTIFVATDLNWQEMNRSTGDIRSSDNYTYDIRGLGYSNADSVLFIAANSTISAVDPDDGTVLYSFAHPATALAADEYVWGWLQAEDKIVSVPPGATVDIPVQFVATDLETSSMTGSISVVPVNVPNVVTVPASLAVTSAADIDFVETIDFGEQFVGFAADSILFIENRGVVDLVVTDIHSDDGRVTSSISAFTLPPRKKKAITIFVNTDAAASINTNIIVTSNDPDESTLTIPLTVNVLKSPAIELDPVSLITTLSDHEKKTLHFTITNSGEGTLHWKVNSSGPVDVEPASVNLTQTGAETQTDVGDMTLKAESTEPMSALAYDEQSGFIYAISVLTHQQYKYDLGNDKWTLIGPAPRLTVAQPTVVNGKIYYLSENLNIYSIQSNQWATVSLPDSRGASAITNDGHHIYVAFGYENLYGVLYKYDPASNTWQQLANMPIGMGDIEGMTYYGGVIYAHQGIEGSAAISGFCKYFVDSDSWLASKPVPGKAYTGSAVDPITMNYFTIGAPQANPDQPVQLSIMNIREGQWSKEVLPFPVDFYATMVYVGKPGFSGLYFCQGSTGKKFGRYETAPAPNWITVTPAQGDLTAADNQSVDVNLDATTLVGGIYTQDIIVSSAHPKISAVLPLKVTVVGAPDISADKTTDDAGDTFVGITGGRQFVIRNTGDAKLIISSVDIDHPEFTFNAINGLPLSSFEIPIGESVTVLAYFTPSATGPLTGTYTLHTNDPDETDFQITLTGNGITTPVLSVLPSSITMNLLSGQVGSQDMTVTNSGGGSVFFATSNDTPSQWLGGFQAEQGVIHIGESVTNPITFDAGGLTAGTYTNKLTVYAYEPDLETVAEIPVTLNVSDAPHLIVNEVDIDFGKQFIGQVFRETVAVRNNGSLPLHISSITSDQPAFTVSVSDPVVIAPGDELDLDIFFSSITPGDVVASITIMSDNPDGSKTLNVKGSIMGLPRIESNTTSLSYELLINESRTQAISLSNPGAGTLTWHAVIEQAANPGEDPTSDNPFVVLTSATAELIAPAMDTTTGIMYAYSPNANKVYSYDFNNNIWPGSPDVTAPYKRGGSVLLNSRMYVVYPDDPDDIHIYTIPFAEWTTVPNQLGAPTGNITTDGTLLYLAGGGMFKSFNPKKNIWTTLATPTISLNGTGGLSYFNGMIYAHEGGGSGFARYSISTGEWETLVSLPGDALLGSTMDPSKGRYYACGKNVFYEYGINSAAWTPYVIPQFEAGDGGLFYKPGNNGGIYFLQGSTGRGFAKFTPEEKSKWLRVAPIASDVIASESTSVVINVNAEDLKGGQYEGMIHLIANDPRHSEADIQVTMNVTDPAPKIHLPPPISVDARGKLAAYFLLSIANDGTNDLDWNFGNLPNGVSASVTSGVVTGHATTDITMAIDATKVSGGQTLTFLVNSNDPTNPQATATLFVTGNHPPVVLKEVNVTAFNSTPVQFVLALLVSDADNDVLTYSVVLNDPSIADVSVSVSTGLLIVRPKIVGFTTGFLAVADPWGGAADVPIAIDVAAVTGLEPDPIVSTFSSSPNPFDKDIMIRYHAEEPVVSEVVLIDVSGRIVLRSGAVQEKDGENEIHLEAAGLSAGIYNCALLRNGTMTHSVRVMRR